MSETGRISAAPAVVGLGVGRWLIVAAIAIWVAALQYFTRFHMLDDALIHLRYAHEYAKTHMVTFDGVHATAGCSSIGYMLLLSGLSRLSSTDFLAKDVSIVFYVLLVAVLTFLALWKTGWTRLVWTGLVLGVLSPSGIRWLSDGMETGLVALAIILLILATEPAPGRRTSPTKLALSWLIGAAIGLLRPTDLSVAICLNFVCAAWFVLVWIRRHPGEGRRDSSVLRGLSPAAIALVGFLVGGVVSYLVSGYLIPDTAIAKSGPPQPLTYGIFNMARSTGSALEFGALILLTLLIGTIAGVARWGCRFLLSSAVACAGIAALTVIIARKGVMVQGMRHILWPYIIAVGWLAVYLKSDSVEAPMLWPRRALAALCVLGILGFVGDGLMERGVFTQRSATFVAMREQNLSRLADHTGAGYDIGFISYFTHADMQDFNGLINGTDWAHLTTAQRIPRIAAMNPDFLMLTSWQARDVQNDIDLKSYTVVAKYLFKNVGKTDAHFLAVRTNLIGELRFPPGPTLDTIRNAPPE